METTSDYILVTLARGGDKEAFALLVERYQMMVFQLARRLTNDNDIARELAQEAILEAYLSLEHLREASRFRSWLYGITLNVCRNYLRQQKLNLVSLNTLPEEGQLELINDYNNDQLEDKNTVADAIKQLSPANQAVANLFYFAQLSLQEIAAKLNISVVAVKSRLHKIRRELRVILLPHYPERVARKIKMIEVKIGEVLEQRQYALVILLDSASQRALPLWIGYLEGLTVLANLPKRETPYPSAYSLMTKMLKISNSKVEAVRIDAFKDDTYYAVIKLRNGENIEEIETRLSEALGIAAETKCPLYVTEEIMGKNAVPVKLDNGKIPVADLDNVVNLMKQRRAEANLSTNARVMPEQPRNLNFEDGLKGWHLAGLAPGNYEDGVDRNVTRNGKACAFIKSKITDTNGSASLIQNIQAQNYRGKRIRFTGYIKCEAVEVRAGLAMDIISNRHMRNFGHDNMEDRPLKGTLDWQFCEIVLDVPQEADFIMIGALLQDKGQIWLADLKFEEVSTEVNITAPHYALISPRNLDFRQGRVGWNDMGSNVDDYMFEFIANFRQADSVTLHFKSTVANPQGQIHFMQTIMADHYRNKRLQVTYFGKSQNIRMSAGVSLQVNSANNAVLTSSGFNFGQPVRGTTDWKKYVVEVEVPEKADRIYLSIRLQDKGEFWVDGLTFEVLEIENTPKKDMIAEVSEASSNPVVVQAVDNLIVFTSHPGKYSYTLDTQVQQEGRNTLRFEGEPTLATGFALLNKFMIPAKYYGKQVKLSGYLKTIDLTGWTGLMLQMTEGVEQLAEGTLNMRDNPIRGDSDWQYYELTAVVPETCQSITYGLILVGAGKVWLSQLEFDIVE
jgi:RNA polymerase sigma factor (sigma-70 family)